MYIYIYIYIHIYIYVYLYIDQRSKSSFIEVNQRSIIFKEVNIADIKNCLTFTVKVESFKSITRRQNICNESYEAFLDAVFCAFKLF